MLALLAACSPGPVQRPLEGAPVGGGAARPDGSPAADAVPPTVSPNNASPGPLASPSASPSPSPVSVGGFVIVATDGAGANMREGPSTSARVITTLAEGTPVETLGQPVNEGGRAWQQIRANGRDGWVVAVVVRRR